VNNLRHIYYNTNGLSGEALIEAQEHIQSQEEVLLYFFLTNSDSKYTREEIHRIVFPQSPESSVPRALRNLTKAGYLVKSDDTVDGIYNTPVHTWKLKEREPVVQGTMF